MGNSAWYKKPEKVHHDETAMTRLDKITCCGSFLFAGQFIFSLFFCRVPNRLFQSRYPDLKCRTESRNPDCHIRHPASRAYFQFQISLPFSLKIPNPGLLMRKISGISKNLLGTLYMVMCDDDDIEGLSGGFLWLRAVNLKPLVSLLFSVKESKNIACENIGFCSLLAAGDGLRGETPNVLSGGERGETDVFAG